MEQKPSQAATQQRGRKSKTWLVAVGSVLAVMAVVAGTSYYLMRPVVLRIAVGPPNSDDVKLVQSISQIFSRGRLYIRLRPILTDGAVASAADIASGATDLAVIRGDLELPKEAQNVAVIRKNFAVLWAPGNGKKKSAITKMSQLSGKRIGIIGRTQANVNLLKIVLSQSGVKPESIQIVQFSTVGFADAIRNEKIDAFLAVGPLNSRITADAIAATSKNGEPTFLGLDNGDAIAQKFPTYESGEIPAGAFGTSPVRPDDKIDTITFSHHIVARKSLSDTTVAALTRQLFSIRQDVQNEFPTSAKLETPDTDKDAAIPVHPGAAAYVDGEEKTFLDKYSDYIWGSLMGLSALGSAGAWFAGYLRRDERNSNTSLRERLLEMLALARKTNSIEELDQMQAEADEIMRDTLHCFEHGAIEEGSLTAFSIALEQFHNAVADRKSFLMEMPATSGRPTRSHVA